MARSSAGIQNQGRAEGAAGGCGDVKLLSARMAELGKERSWICVQRKRGWPQDFRRDPTLPQPRGRKRMLGAGQGQQLVGGEKREDSTVYPRALFKYVVRGGQTQESE